MRTGLFGKVYTKVLASFLTVVVLMTSFDVNIVKAEDESIKGKYVSYRVDTIEYLAKGYDKLAIDFSSNFDAKVYACVRRTQDSSLTAAELKELTAVNVSADTEKSIYCGYYNHKYSLEAGDVVNVFIGGEDASGKFYGPYVVNNHTLKYFPAGDGSASNAYQIWNWRHLANVGAYGSKNVCFQLMQEIDMSEYPYDKKCITDSDLAGSFQGNNHSILNSKASLFDWIKDTGVVYNTFVVNSYISNGSTGVIANQNKGKISHCAVIKTSLYPKSNSDAGGLVGVNNGSIYTSKVQDVTVWNSGSVGGIAGDNRGLIEKCYSEAIVGGSYATAGGIAGNNYGAIRTCWSNALPDAKIEGGIAGGNHGDAVITNCASQVYTDDPESVLKSVGGGYLGGSIVGYINGNGDYILLNSGAVNHPAPLPEIPDDASEEEINRIMNYYNNVTVPRWTKHHGEVNILTGLTFEDPVVDIIAEAVADLAGFFTVHCIAQSKLHYETNAYNKAFPMTEIELVKAKASGESKTEEPIKSVKVSGCKVTATDMDKKEVQYDAPASTKAKSVTIPKKVTVNKVEYKVTSIKTGAFKNNKYVTKITASNVQNIGSKAFYGAKKLKTVTLGKKVNKIGAYAFKNCKVLKTITIKSTKLTSKNVAKNAFKGIGNKTVIKVPKKKLKAYKKLFKSKGLSAKVKIKGI